MLLFLVLAVNSATDFKFYLHTLTLAAHSYALLTELIGNDIDGSQHTSGDDWRAIHNEPNKTIKNNTKVKVINHSL